MTDTYRLVFLEPNPLTGTRLLLGAIVTISGEQYRVRQVEPWWLVALTGKTRIFAEHMHQAMAIGSIRMDSVSPSVTVGDAMALPKAELDPVEFVRRTIVDSRMPSASLTETKPAPDVYRVAADAVGVSRGAVLKSRMSVPLSARWGVWAALRAMGWSYSEIASKSSPDASWDHSTIMYACKKMRDGKSASPRSRRSIRVTHAVVGALRESRHAA